MASLFGRLKGNSVPVTPSLGASPNKKSQTPSTPLERWLAETGPPKENGPDKFFGMHNASNTCYCNSVVQCLYFSEPFRDQVVNFPRLDRTIADVRNGIQANTNGATSEAQTPQKSPEVSETKKPSLNPTTSQTTPQENKESFDYQKKLALAAGPHLRLEHGFFQSYGMPESLFTSLKDLFEAIIAHESRTGVVTPAKFLEVLRRNHETFRSNIHQDAHEFLNILLNEVVEQVEAYSKSIAKQPASAAGLGLSMPSLTSNQQLSAKPMSSWVHELFEGTLTSETRCLTCENISQRDEAFLDLSVDLEEHSSVTSCLRKFSEEEMLCERNKFHCDKCCGLQEAEKRMKVKRLPRILALHLKRFKFIEEIGNFRKLFHRVVYPFHLRLFNTTDDAEDPDRLYELYAVVVHLGSTPFHGHYVSIIKTKDRGWLLFDDELVLPVDKEYVRNFFGGDPRNPACAYVLFYQETSIETVLREQETEDEQANVPAVGEFDAHGNLAGDEDGAASPALTAETAATPAIDEPDPFASLEHAATAPPVPSSQEEELIALPAAHPLDRAPSSEEQRSPSKLQPNVKSGSLNRLRHSSMNMNLRAKPKFWSSKDKAPEGSFEPESSEAAAPQRETAPASPVAKIERAKSGRFSLGKKKPVS